MIDVNKSIIKYLLFGILNIPKGIQLAISLIIIPIYLFEKGIPLHITTLIVGIVIIPWVIKFIWGWVVDYYIQFGRKQFILIGGIFSSICLFILAFIDPAITLEPFVITLFFSNICLSFFDIATTAWAIDISHMDERGKINSVMFTSQFILMAAGSTLFSSIARTFDYSLVFIISGTFILLITLFSIFFKEPKKSIKNKNQTSIIINEFKSKTIQLISTFAIISSISGGLIILVVPLHMRVNLQLDIAQIGAISSIFLLTRALGSLSGGAISDIYGRKKSLSLFIGSSIFFFPLFIISRSLETLIINYGIVGFLLGGCQSAISTVFMDAANKKISATHYSIFASLFNMGRWIGETLVGTFIIIIGFNRIFLYSGWIFGLSILILYFIKLKEN